MQSACWYAWTKMWGLKQLLHCCQNCWALAIFICYICLYYWIHGVSTGTPTFMGTPMFRRDVTIMGSVKTMRRNYKIFRKWLLYEKKKTNFQKDLLPPHADNDMSSTRGIHYKLSLFTCWISPPVTGHWHYAHECTDTTGL